MNRPGRLRILLVVLFVGSLLMQLPPAVAQETQADPVATEEEAVSEVAVPATETPVMVIEPEDQEVVAGQEPASEPVPPTPLAEPQVVTLDTTTPELTAASCTDLGLLRAGMIVDPVETRLFEEGDSSLYLETDLTFDPTVLSWFVERGAVQAIFVLNQYHGPGTAAHLYDYRPYGDAIVADSGLTAPESGPVAVVICFAGPIEEDEPGEEEIPEAGASTSTIESAPAASDSDAEDTVQIAAIGVGGSVRNDVRLNLRTAASITAPIVGVMPVRTVSTVIGGPQTANGYVWWRLQTPIGEGWAAGTYLIEIVPPTPTRTPTLAPGTGITIGATLRVTTPLNLRTSATTTASIVATMPANTQVSVIGGPQSANGYTWWQLTTPYGEGWAAGQYMQRIGSTASATPTRTSTPTASGTPPTSTPTRTVTSTSVASVTPTSTRTSTPTVSPVASATAAPCGPFRYGDVVRTTAGLNLRQSAGTTSTIIGTMPTGMQGTVVGGPTAANGYTWCQLQTPLGQGWAVTNWLAFVSGPRPTPSGTQTPRPEPPPDQGSSRTIYSGPTTVRQIALTYDAGSDRGYASYILDQLARYGVKATFGMTGMWAQSNPDLVIRMVNEGHQLINHTWSHPSFTGGSSSTTVLSRSGRVDQLVRTEDFVRNLTGYEMSPYWRPPYGDINSSVLSDVYSAGFYLTIMWSCDTLAWNGASESQILNRCMYPARSGAIILMHVGADGLDWAATDNMIEYFLANNYQLVTIEEMLD